MELLTVLIVTAAALAIVEAADYLLNEVLFPGYAVEPLPPEEVIDDSLLNQVDRQKAEASRTVLEEHLGSDPVGNLMTLNQEDRIKAVTGIVEDLTRLYGVKIDGLEFSGALPDTVAGCYIRSRRLIQLNIKYLLVNDRAIINDLLDTIFHELRHAIQWSIVTDGGEPWGVTEDHRQTLAANFKHYIQAQRDIQGYQMQLVERDAVTFAAYVLKGVIW